MGTPKGLRLPAQGRGATLNGMHPTRGSGGARSGRSHRLDVQLRAINHTDGRVDFGTIANIELMRVFEDIDPVRAAVCELRRDGQTIGLVPTMGALHEGHLSLVRAAKARCSAVAVTIFVNPTQFAPTEDFTQYPRSLTTDLELCRGAGVDLVFTPAVEAMYGGSPATSVHVAQLTEGLCGPFRPGHFDGVATVVCKLFQIIPADAAFFGEKDYQQLKVIERMVRDLNLAIEIVPCPTVREADGLAMSSRNRTLSRADREKALSLSRALFDARDRAMGGERDAAGIVERIRQTLLAAGPCSIDYVDVVEPDSLAPIARIERSARICVAVRIGATRLIDNVAVDIPPERS